MPSPKAGTVSADPAASVAEFKVRRLQRATPQTATEERGLQHLRGRAAAQASGAGLRQSLPRRGQ
eukprot:scaffold100518_cov45-Phaeocystis_antarctica.AAC.1